LWTVRHVQLLFAPEAAIAEAAAQTNGALQDLRVT